MGKVGAADVKPQVKVQSRAQPEAAAKAPAPATAANPGWTAKPGSAAAAKARAGTTSAFAAGAQPASAAGGSAPLQRLFDPKQRAALTSVSQTNPVSTRLKNDNDICGGASVVAALLQQSGTPETARANADALRGAFKRAPGEGLSVADRARINEALDRFAAGTLDEEDVSYLQQAAYAAGRGVTGGDASPGLTTGAMATLVADLKGSGAAFPPGTSFSQVYDGNSGHWVATAGKAFINTADPKSSAARVRPSQTALDGEAFSGRVRVLDSGGVQLQTRYRGSEMAANGSGWQTTITPTDPRNDVLRAFKGNDKLLDGGVKAATEGPLSP